MAIAIALIAYLKATGAEGVVGAAYIPADGYVDPYTLTQAYAKGARQNGVKTA